ncbi:hypothetical protein CRH09_02710 [Nocardia terpenica]|uniref:HTH cro/C1-type domain-containing protein n=1 Tax=Nocardia terpenica TaxID=455432 RepID=A0A291RCJ8_9NOCA|nr:hypothetical protein CRH09_02710 [Nocardia terpenica]
MGYKVSRSAIADIENRRRKYISTAELSVIAWALAVPPVRLLYPALPDGDAEIVPGVHTSATYAMTWFSGETQFAPARLSTGDLKAPIDEEWHADAARVNALYEGYRLVGLSRQRLRTRERIRSLSKLIADFEAESPELVRPFITELTSLQGFLEQTLRDLHAYPDAIVSDESTDDSDSQPKIQRRQDDSER